MRGWGPITHHAREVAKNCHLQGQQQRSLTYALYRRVIRLGAVPQKEARQLEGPFAGICLCALMLRASCTPKTVQNRGGRMC